ncbi:MAG: DNA polymerase III subunit delta [Chloroflexi bacterium]|nr:DNA polymerase III subunit delta [Chloroflexota bacterium]
MFYILYGEDEFSLKVALDGIKDSLGSREMLDSNTLLLDGRELVPAQLISVCDTAPFLSEKRLVIVQGLLERWEEKREEHLPAARTVSRKKGLEEWRALKDYVQRMPSTTVLVLVGGRLNKANPLLRELYPLANVQEFPVLKGVELIGWIRSRMGAKGCSISTQATQTLANLVGGNLWAMNNEIEKLCLYVQGRRIEEKDVELLVADAQEGNIFALVDAAAARNLPKATRILHKLMDEGAVAPYILAMLTRQFRMLIQCKEMVYRKASSQDISGRLGLTQSFVLKKTLARAGEYSMERLRKTYAQLLEADLSMKTGQLRDELALDILVAKLCS